jgi:hypothetical protein
LERVTEEKLLSLIPSKEREKIARLKSKANPSEVAEAESKLFEWQKKIREADKALKTTAAEEHGNVSQVKTIFNDTAETPVSTRARSSLPPVRGSATVSSTAPKASQLAGSSIPIGTNKPTAESAAADSKPSSRISGYNFSAWEKFDVESELQSLEDTDQATKSTSTSRSESQQKEAELARMKEQKRADLHRREMEKILHEMNASALSDVQRIAASGTISIYNVSCNHRSLILFTVVAM